MSARIIITDKELEEMRGMAGVEMMISSRVRAAAQAIGADNVASGCVEISRDVQTFTTQFEIMFDSYFWTGRKGK